MFARLGGLVVRARWLVIALSVGILAVGGIWGTRVVDSLSDGGFYPEHGPSAEADRRIEQVFGRQNADVVVVYTSDRHTIDDEAFTKPVTSRLSGLAGRAEVADVRSFFRTGSPAFVSRDEHSTFAAISLTGTDEATRADQFEKVRELLPAPGTTTLVGGREAALADFNKKTEEGILTAEIIATPILTVLMLIIFGGVVAASMPLVVAVLAVLGGFTITRLLTQVTDISVFAINVITIIGLGLAIDYSLFIVSRFREELAAGADERTAVVRTMATAGRTVVVSGATVLLALAGLLIVPLPFLHGIALGGGAAIGVAIVSALVVLPAVLAVLGRRIDALSVRGRRGPRRRGTSEDDSLGAWARIGAAVMRRPVAYLVGVLAVLIVAATPFLHASFETVDERVLPAGTESRVVAERVRSDFPGGADGTLLLMVDGGGRAAADTVSGAVQRMDHVVSVTPIAAEGRATLLQVKASDGEQGPGTRALAGELGRLAPPEGATLHVSGLAAQVNDQMDAIAGGLPWLVLTVVGVTLVMLFFAFGSILMPIKAVLMNLVSIGAAFGAVVWSFQDGHLAGILGFTERPVEASNLVLILVLLFGLATDYEVFLLSRVREEWDKSGDNTRSVLVGMQRTGGIITAAALLLIVVVATFTTGGVSFLKLIGIGMTVAIFVDATLVRMVLVPATMRILGDANWWAPRPLRRFYATYGIRESGNVPAAPAGTAAAAERTTV